MAYGQLYEVEFKNRVQNDVYRAEVWKKDTITSITSLEGSENPFTAEYQGSDDDLFAPIKTLLITLSFITDGSIAVEDFYSEDDELWRIDFYYAAKLLYTGYLLQDECSESITDIAHVITLKATDNLGLLKDVLLDEPFGGVENVYGKKTVKEIIDNCLTATGLDIYTKIYSNIFENTTDDRSVSTTADMFMQSVLHTGTFRNDSGEYDNCYNVLTIILSSLNAVLVQKDGAWNIIRIGEYSQFADGEIKGTLYNPAVSAITLNPLIDIGRSGTIIPVNEDQIKSVQRPYKSAKNTFNYKQPASLIIQQDLSLPDGAIPYDTATVAGIRTDKYDLPTYFPLWTQINADASYLVVITDTNVTPETETDRYMVTPCCTATLSSVRFNPIEVSAGDKFNFSIRYRTDNDTDTTLRFWVRFLLVLPNGNYRGLFQFDGASNIYLHWNPEFASGAINNDSSGQVYKEFTNPNDVDTTEWIDWTLTEFTTVDRGLPVIPEDGMLYIQVMGTNGSLITNTQGTYWKDMKLEFTNYINNSTQIIGQTHIEANDILAKNKYEEEINVDDSPRNTIAGTLFTDAITNFPNDIGDIYFTKTYAWHRLAAAESLKLGNIITLERLAAQQATRRMVEGTFMNLRNGSEIVNMLNLFTFDFYINRYFLLSTVTINFMECTFNGKFIELFADSDNILAATYLYTYLYDTKK